MNKRNFYCWDSLSNNFYCDISNDKIRDFGFKKEPLMYFYYYNNNLTLELFDEAKVEGSSFLLI